MSSFNPRPQTTSPWHCNIRVIKFRLAFYHAVVLLHPELDVDSAWGDNYDKKILLLLKPDAILQLIQKPKGTKYGINK